MILFRSIRTVAKNRFYTIPHTDSDHFIFVTRLRCILHSQFFNSNANQTQSKRLLIFFFVERIWRTIFANFHLPFVSIKSSATLAPTNPSSTTTKPIILFFFRIFFFFRWFSSGSNSTLLIRYTFISITSSKSKYLCNVHCSSSPPDMRNNPFYQVFI